jgi:hypothetical protein
VFLLETELLMSSLFTVALPQGLLKKRPLRITKVSEKTTDFNKIFYVFFAAGRRVPTAGNTYF